MTRREFLKALGISGCAIALPSFGRTSELERCREDIAYFADNYITIHNHAGNAVKMTVQQRNYLGRVSSSSGRFVCVKGRQVGVSTANNVFAYWKNVFFENQHVWLVEPNMGMAERAAESFSSIDSDGGFRIDPYRIHFTSPHAMNFADWRDHNNTFILDEFAFWRNERVCEDIFTHVSTMPEDSAEFVVVSTPTCVYSLFEGLFDCAGDDHRMVLTHAYDMSGLVERRA